MGIAFNRAESHARDTPSSEVQGEIVLRAVRRASVGSVRRVRVSVIVEEVRKTHLTYSFASVGAQRSTSDLRRAVLVAALGRSTEEPQTNE